MKYFKTKHQKDSAKITTLFTLILVLLLFVVGQDYKEQPDEYGVAINFSSASSNEQKVSQEKPQEVDENVDNEKIEEEVVEEEVVEEKVVEEETPEENVTEEALENEEKLREEAEEAENLRKELEAKKKAETEAKELEAQKTKELAEKKAKAKELAEKEAKAKEAAEKAKALEEAKALADAKAKAESEAKAAAAAAKKEKEGIGETPFALIENAPIYPGCEGGDNEAKKKCMSDKIKKFITQKFDTDLASDLSGIQKINISFKINTAGNVVSISAKASNPKLEAEAKRVTSLLPKMKPGMQQGKAVVVSYGLPIRIKPED